MYAFTITDKFLSIEEREIFNDYLNFCELEDNIWAVFTCLSKASDKNIQHN